MRPECARSRRRARQTVRWHRPLLAREGARPRLRSNCPRVGPHWGGLLSGSSTCSAPETVQSRSASARGGRPTSWPRWLPRRRRTLGLREATMPTSLTRNREQEVNRVRSVPHTEAGVRNGRCPSPKRLRTPPPAGSSSNGREEVKGTARPHGERAQARHLGGMNIERPFLTTVEASRYCASRRCLDAQRSRVSLRPLVQLRTKDSDPPAKRPVFSVCEANDGGI